ncbi:hypothetical protein SAMN06265182_0989 [Persephonella hydrogeniphila]|uniref:Uncharacterized protein n=1 Tax=Persephonella hydrogeniphila TaxID=198703 RepID=A0A285NJ98_9AQUI|nr:hypothetical protein [Persephonella hydrogeniphila]SNZ07731.1 hypothetical protein SAMN06265182_0989 [Persephonella hydrogeniphila]
MATYNEKAWAFVRKTKQPFTAWDLARVAQVSYSFARKYVYYLQRAEYLKIVGKRGKERLYRTIRITGVKPVKVNHHKKVVIDENTGEVFSITKTKRSEIRQRIWDAIKELQQFTTSDIYKKTLVATDSIRDYVRFLEKAGFVEKISKKEKYTVYKLSKSQEEYPEAKKEIQSKKLKQPKEKKYQAIWNLIRTLPQFTVKELSKQLPDIHPESIRIYVKHLRRAGYLEIVKKTQYDGFLYRLVRDSGKKAPILRLPRKKTPTVYDPNKDKTYLSIGE